MDTQLIQCTGCANLGHNFRLVSYTHDIEEEGLTNDPILYVYRCPRCGELIRIPYSSEELYENKKALDILAIESSIKDKWDIAAQCGLDLRNRLSEKHCTLCAMYWHDMCEDCPVFLKTGYEYCSHTPYMELSRLFGVYHTLGIAHNAPLVKSDIAHIADIIEAEIEFLISLLPKTHKWRQL